MEHIFQKDEKGFIKPVFREDLTDKSFLKFLNIVKQLNIEDNIVLIKDFLNILKKTPDICQMILDINDLFKINEKEFLELLIDLYCYENIKKDDKKFLENFFYFISNPFTIKKNIYDYIYRKIGNMFQIPLLIKENPKKLFKNCLNLLNIFYQNEEINYEFFKDNFFYLCNNELITNITTENVFKINNILNINFYIYINENYNNLNSSLLKISFSNVNGLEIKLSNNNNIEILFNYNKIYSINIEYNKWIFFKIFIQQNKNKKCEINININDINWNFIISKEINEIIKLSFFSEFCGIISPIIIFEKETVKENFFTKKYIKELIYGIKENKSNINNNVVINSSNNEINENVEFNNEFYFDIPILLFINKNNEYDIKGVNSILLKRYKKEFPNFYSYNHINFKKNIFLIGGIKNLLPLFEITYNLYNDDNEKMIKTFSKIIKILNSILSHKHNMEDSINSHFFTFFFIIIEKLNENNINLFKNAEPIFKQLISSKEKNESFYNEIKGFILNKNFIQIILNIKNEYIDFLLRFNKYKNEVYYYLINLILEYYDKNYFNDEFYNKIFTYFYHYLQNEKDEKIKEVFIFLYTDNMSDKIIEKTLFLIIKLLNIKISNKEILIKLQSQQTKIKILINSNEKTNEKKTKKLTKEEEEIKNQIDKKYSLFKFLLKSHLFNFIEDLSKRKEPNIKLLIINLFQVLIVYYIYFFKEIDIDNLNIYTEKIENFLDKEYILQYNSNKTTNIYNNIANLFSEDENNIISTDIYYKLYNDFIQIVQCTNKISFKDYKNVNFSNYQNLFFSFFNNLFYLARMNYYSQFYYKINISNFNDLYNNFPFINTLIPLFHHIFTINSQIDNPLSKITQEYIENIISDIFLDGVENSPSSFLFIIDQFDTYIYENYNDENINKFKFYFFELIGKKNAFIHLVNEKVDIIEKFGNEFYTNKHINYKKMYENFISAFKNIKIFGQFISQFNIFNFDYIILKKFFMNFEIYTINPENFDINLKYFIFIIIFCIILSDKNYQIYSKSNQNCFFLRLSLFAIKSMLLKIYIKNDPHNVCVKLVTFFMSILHYSIKNYQIIFNFENKNDEKKLKNYINEFHNIFTKSKDDISFIEKAKNIIIDNKDNLLKLLKNYLIPIESFEVEAFPYILTEIFLEPYKQKFTVNQIFDKNHFKKYQIIKSYKKMKKELFIFNNSYSNVDLFYTEEGRKKLKFKILNHYSREMSLPFIFPILNLNKYIPNNFNKFFNSEFQGFDLIGNSIFDENFNEIRNKIINKRTNLSNSEMDESSLNDSTLNSSSINLSQNIINMNDLISDIDSNILKNYFKITSDKIFSSCLIKQGLHIPGYIICKKEEFFFISFPKELIDSNYLYFDNNKKLCYGSEYKLNNIYTLNIKLLDILFVYKKYYIFKDNSLEIFTKYNKSYFFEINSNDETYLKKSSISKIRDKFFNYITKLSSSSTNERYYYGGKIKGIYNNIDSLLLSLENKNISMFEFLTRINLISNRSFKDVNQYPIFPWIISNYSLKNEIKDFNDLLKKENLRNLSKPISIIDEKRLNKSIINYDNMKKKFIEKFNDITPLDYSIYDKLLSLNDKKSIPKYFENHYLNSDSVYFYMGRIFPYSIPHLLIQEKNKKKHILTNINNCYIDITQKGNDNFMELIPEFYYNSEIFRNINNINYNNIFENENIINLNNRINNNNINNNVDLPIWSKNNPEKFISIMREILERPEIKIFDWIDLTFGYAQKGIEALKKYNIYPCYSYEGFIHLDKIPIGYREFYINQSSKGVNPSQIFNKKINYNQKIEKKKNEKNEKNEIKDEINEVINNNSIINDLEIKIKDNIKKLENEISKNKNEENKKNEKNRTIKSLNDKIYKSNQFLKKIKTEKYEIKQYKQIFILYNFYEGDILIYNLKSISNEFILPINIRNNISKNNIISSFLDNSEITSTSFDKFFLFGTKLGSILIYKNGKDRIDKIIHNNIKEILSLEQNYVLNIFISSSKDGYINIYTLPNIHFVNSIFLPYFYANKILISFSPIPSFIIYNEKNKSFKSFSINGRDLLNYDKYIFNAKEIKLELSDNFIEFLIINNNYDKKYKMPFLEDFENKKIDNNFNNKKEKKGNNIKKRQNKTIIR